MNMHILFLSNQNETRVHAACTRLANRNTVKLIEIHQPVPLPEQVVRGYDVIVTGTNPDPMVLGMIERQEVLGIILGTLETEAARRLQKLGLKNVMYMPELLQRPWPWNPLRTIAGFPVIDPETGRPDTDPFLAKTASLLCTENRVEWVSLFEAQALHVAERRAALAAIAAIYEVQDDPDLGTHLPNALRRVTSVLGPELLGLASTTASSVYPAALHKEGSNLVFAAYAVNQGRWHRAEREMHEGTFVDHDEGRPYSAVPQIMAHVEQHRKDSSEKS